MSTRPRQPRPETLQKQADAWNAKHPVGTRVVVTKDNTSAFIPGTTTSEAYVMGGHSAVIHIDTISGCYLLSRVTACPAPQEAA